MQVLLHRPHRGGSSCSIANVQRPAFGTSAITSSSSMAFDHLFSKSMNREFACVSIDVASAPTTL